MTVVDIHASLNAAQRAAATHGEPRAGGVDAGPLLVIAGAGTGKTGTLAHRVAHLLLAGVIDGKPSASQWKYEVPDGLKVRYTSAIENATRHAMPSRLNLPIVSPCPR